MQRFPTTYINDNALSFYPFVTTSDIPFGKHTIKDLKATIWADYIDCPEVKVCSVSVSTDDVSVALLLRTADEDDNPGGSNVLFPWVYLGTIKCGFRTECTAAVFTTAHSKVHVMLSAGISDPAYVGSYACDLPLAASAINYVSKELMGGTATYSISGMKYDMPQVLSMVFNGYFVVSYPEQSTTGLDLSTRVVTITADVPDSAATSIEDQYDNYSMVNSVNSVNARSSSADGKALVLKIGVPDTAPAGAAPEDYIQVKIDNAQLASDIVTGDDPDPSLASSTTSSTVQRTEIWEQLGGIRPDAVIVTLHGTEKFPNCYDHAEDDASDIDDADEEDINAN